MDGFWNDKNKSSKTIKELNSIKGIVGEFNKISDGIDELELLIEFVEAGEDGFEEELETKFQNLIEEIETFDTNLLLDGEYDENGAIFTIHAGAGGTESCDWADMLYRMYSRWFHSKGYKVEELDFQHGDTVGIKSISVLVSGPRAYGYLKGEKGVHRLVRISPFDAAKKRHTSFASIDVTPEIDDTINIEINPSELKIDTFRSGGAGGQHVNTTDSAVRITHLPTGVVVGCQNGRSQLQNRETALKMLKSKLLDIEMKKREDELKRLHGEQSDNSWGNQIRSYVFQPYTMVKDHRTGEESGNVKAVMDGEIDNFITAYLRWMKK
jgi:peptide chain release factor 2